MSRIGKKPVPIPAGVSVSRGGGRQLLVKGPKGQLALDLRPEIDVALEGGCVLVRIVQGEGTRESRAFHGLTRSLINGMVEGVSKGFEKRLEIQGVGWNASAQGRKVVLNIGFNKPVTVAVPEGITVTTPDPTNIIITGADKQAVGHLAASIRTRRPPEPYKGKGVRYKDEVVRRKAGKSFGS